MSSIDIQNNVFHLQTANTSYVLSVKREGLLENMYYGARIKIHNSHPIQTKRSAGFGCDVRYKANVPALSSLLLDLSPAQRGDYRTPALLAKMPHGGMTSDFVFKSARVMEGSSSPSGSMPKAHSGSETLALVFAESSGLQVELFYTVFYDADVITKKMRITNRSKNTIELWRAMSQQLDLPTCDYDVHTLHGAWAREAHVHKHSLQPGRYVLGSGTGCSSNRSNPFFFVAQKNATESAGDVYGFNLVYSGSHEASVEVDALGQTRILQGILSEDFAWELDLGESFVTPEAVLTFSKAGKNGMSQNMHAFVKNHIIPQKWNNMARPVLVNNWEGTYFSFDERKLLGMAGIAAKLGVELFVLDDGWFGKRNNDRAGLGDYDINTKKLPNGIAGLAKKIKKLGMKFGLWFEPEMVNKDSDLYRAHPEWIVQTPGYEPCEGRYQYVLDLCLPEVQDYIISSVNKILDSAEISYVKWDMNRNISDNFSPDLPLQGMFSHSFILGLYRIFDAICKSHPNVLFEGCASGGNRFDLGILSYMPQIWASDDTDAYERQKIQTGLSYGYPLCTMGAHVSAVPNHQTLRRTPLETRFNVAAFGLLGYELDMRHLTAHDREDIKLQIAYYKQHRNLLQYGNFYRLRSPFEENGCGWLVVSPDKSEALLGDYMHLSVPNISRGPLRLTGLDTDKLYTMVVREQKMELENFGGMVNHVLPVMLKPGGLILKTAAKVYRMPTEKEQYTAYGSLLCEAGVRLRQELSGGGYSEDLRLVSDFSSRLYYFKSDIIE